MNNRSPVQIRFSRGASVLAWFLLAAAGAPAAGIGPDAFGYVATDVTVYSFVDITLTGVGVLAGADDDTAVVNIGFPFRFYGQTYTSLCLSSNGLVSFGGCNIAFANQDLTASSPPGNFPTAAPFWGDLTFAAKGAGAIYYQTLGSAGSRQFIVQWKNAYPINASEGVTFQAIFYESSNRILFQYQDVNAGAGSPASFGALATVGIRDTNSQSNGRRLQWSYNAPVLKSGTALEFLPLGLTPVDLGVAGPSYWALLSLGRPTSIAMEGSSSVTGDVAHVGAAGSTGLDMSGSSRIDGKLWLSSAGKLAQSGQSVIVGGVVKGPAADTMLQQAVSDATAASATAAALPTTIPGFASINISSPAGNLTITGGPGRNVLSLTDLIITKGTLTLNAPAGATFVVNVSRKCEVTGESAIQVAGGLLARSVLYNVTGTGADVSLSGGSKGGVPTVQVSGIVLAPSRTVNLAPGALIGELIAGGAKITLEGQSRISNIQRLTQYLLTVAASPAAGGKVTGGGLYSAGASATVTATANPGYQFQHFSGDLTGSANPQTLTMNGPKNVVANFAALTPLVTASVTGKTGPAKARVWTLKLTNSGLGWANNSQITSLAFKQVSGTACSVAPVVVTALPVAAGTLAPSGGTATVPVTVNFEKCPTAARFSVTVRFQANGGAYTGSTVINNQYQ